jgi:hypothetical protein
LDRKELDSIVERISLREVDIQRVLDKGLPLFASEGKVVFKAFFFFLFFSFFSISQPATTKEFDFQIDATLDEKTRIRKQKKNLKKRLGLIDEDDVSSFITDEDLVPRKLSSKEPKKSDRKGAEEMLKEVLESTMSPRMRNKARRQAKLQEKQSQLLIAEQENPSKRAKIETTEKIETATTETSSSDSDSSWPLQSFFSRLCHRVFEFELQSFLKNNIQNG